VVAILQTGLRKLDEQLWEADAVGVGWLGLDDHIELIQSDPRRPAALTAGRWLFSEMICQQWHNATQQSARQAPVGMVDLAETSATPGQPAQDRLVG
jgi:hypothetical protein